MNTNMLVRQFAAENGLSLRDARKYVLSAIEIIEEGLLSYGEVKLFKHFIIKTVDVPEKTVWSNLFHKYMKCGGYKTVKFVVCKPFQDKLDQLYKRMRGHE